MDLTKEEISFILNSIQRTETEFAKYWDEENMALFKELKEKLEHELRPHIYVDSKNELVGSGSKDKPYAFIDSALNDAEELENPIIIILSDEVSIDAEIAIRLSKTKAEVRRG